MGVMDKFLNYMKLNDDEDEGFTMMTIWTTRKR